MKQMEGMQIQIPSIGCTVTHSIGQQLKSKCFPKPIFSDYIKHPFKQARQLLISANASEPINSLWVETFYWRFTGREACKNGTANQSLRCLDFTIDPLQQFRPTEACCPNRKKATILKILIFFNLRAFSEIISFAENRENFKLINKESHKSEGSLQKKNQCTQSAVACLAGLRV